MGGEKNTVSRDEDISVPISRTWTSRFTVTRNPQLVQLEKERIHLPIMDKSKTLHEFVAEDGKEMIDRANDDPNDKENLLLLDVRNGYEWDDTVLAQRLCNCSETVENQCRR